PSGKIKHVVYIEFDNVHFTRDNPNVPSDLEQMPNLLNFLKDKGTLDAGDHTVLISHTANDILTTQTGLYSDDDGIFIANNFGVFQGGNAVFPSSFFYWTDRVEDITTTPPNTDANFALTTPSGQNVPAPWVPFTRAGCTVGAFSTANIVLERTPFDVVKVFGAGSPQALESTSTLVKPNQTDDFEGAAIHCALSDPICSTNASAVSDLLPDEPGGYTGYQALFGLKYIAPALGGITDYHKVPITGFQSLSFDPTPAQTLAVVEDMLKKGIPVVFAYIADAHDNQSPRSTISSPEGTFGPGEAAYVAQLADYNAAFGTFFANLKAAGIDESNTLFIFTPDEGDHFVGGAPDASCDGAKIEKDSTVVPDVPCTYTKNGVGELDINLAGLTAAAGDATTYSIHTDDAATTYVNGQPLPLDSSVRTLERTMAGLSATNPHTGLNESLLGTGLGASLEGAIVDPAAMRLVHMHTQADLNREPTFTFFGNPNFFFETSGSTTPVVGAGFAWNHGDIQPEIARTFIGIVGPGVKNLGITDPDDFFTDHVDVRPTMMALLGLKDDYEHDGRVIAEMLDHSVLPDSLEDHSNTLLDLGQVYKQINAPFGELSENTLAVSTYAIKSDSLGDAVYFILEAKIDLWTAERDALAGEIKSLLEGAEFDGASIDDKQVKDLIKDSRALLDQASDCAQNLHKCGSF
ncbi:MAG TPA: hypothetical protein VNU19_20935, partial [Candidatus Acidoferrum sp.]|nr:hypothetical protein [Candidatus Acidoferrum sp.]